MLISTLLILAPAHGCPAAAATALPITGHAAPQGEIDRLIEDGKTFLLEGKTNEAASAFEAAHAAAGAKNLRTELWVLRGRIAKGEVAKAFDRVVEIEGEYKDDDPKTTSTMESDLAYVIGAGRFSMARAAAGNARQAGTAYQDAASYLKTIDLEAYPDAAQMLAYAAFQTGDMDTAARAADAAIARRESAGMHLLAARAHVARGAAMLSKDPKSKDGKAAVALGIDAAKKALARMPKGKEDPKSKADVYLQVGVAQLYLGDANAAARAYGEAMAWDPSSVDFYQLMSSLRTEKDGYKPYIETLGSAARAFDERWGEGEAGDALIHWWKGYAEYYGQAYKDGIASFEEALKEWPQRTDSHWYIGLCHFRLDPPAMKDAAGAWLAYHEADPAGFVGFIKSNTRDNLAYLGAVTNALWNNSRGGANMLIAAQLSEIALKVDPSDATKWNDVGLFARDAGDHVRRTKDGDDWKERSQAHYERAYEAYAKLSSWTSGRST